MSFDLKLAVSSFVFFVLVGALIGDRTLLKRIEANGANTNVAIQDLQKDITMEAAAQELWRQKDRDKNIGAGENIIPARHTPLTPTAF